MTVWTDESAAVSAPAKINLCLQIVGKRTDGYHLLDSIVAPISLYDRLRIRICPAASPAVSIRCHPADAAPPGVDNLAARAASTFMCETQIAANVSIDLVKQIPSGAGLGGGSSDAAAVLRGLNALLREPLSQAELMAMGLSLGADVPLFVFGRPARMQGIGERLERSAVASPPVVVAFSGGGLSTQAVYAKYDDLLTMSGPVSTIRPPAPGQEPPRTMLHNDLEAAAFQIDPALRFLKKELRSLGAEGVAMTGSGGAIFGVWRVWDDARAAAQQLRVAGVWARVVRVLEAIPAVELIAD